MSEEIKKGLIKINDTLEHVYEWMDRHREWVDLAPKVQEIIDTHEWAKRAIEQRPLAIGVPASAHFEDIAETDRRLITMSLPLPQKADANFSLTATSTSASVAGVVLQLVQDAERLPFAEAQDYANKFHLEYRELQEAQRRTEEVRRLLMTHIPSLVPKFETASDAYRKLKARFMDDRATANHMRIFVDGLKGELFDMADAHTNSDKKNWGIVLERLYGGSPKLTEIVRREALEVRLSLYGDLSATGKGWNSSFPKSADGLWARVLDHAHILLNGLNKGE